MASGYLALVSRYWRIIGVAAAISAKRSVSRRQALARGPVVAAAGAG